MDGQGPGLQWSKLYPSWGDSALAELALDGRVWGEMRLEGISSGELGEARTAAARVVLRVFDSGPGDVPLEFDLDQMHAILSEARQWLLENEQGRIPVLE